MLETSLLTVSPHNRPQASEGSHPLAAAPYPPQELEVLFKTVERAKYLWESTFDAMLHPVIILDQKYIIQRANAAFASAAGLKLTQVSGKFCYEVFALKKTPCENCPLESSFKNGTSACAHLAKFKDGREYEAVSVPLKGHHQDLDLAIVQYRDLREEKELQARLVQSEKMAAVGLLAGGVAHEINNPLAGILAFAQLAARQLELQTSPDFLRLKEDIQEIESAALRCKNIVENLLKFSHPSLPDAFESLDLKRVVQNITPLLKVQLKEFRVSLQSRFEEHLPPIFGNANQLEQVFLNLTSNACHAMNRGGKITLAIQKDPLRPFVKIRFSDTGKGIRAGDLPKIFDPFFTTKRPGVGTGLGLAIVYNIVQDHKGWIETESSSEHGTTFLIFLPVHQEV